MRILQLDLICSIDALIRGGWNASRYFGASQAVRIALNGHVLRSMLPKYSELELIEFEAAQSRTRWGDVCPHSACEHETFQPHAAADWKKSKHEFRDGPNDSNS